MAYNPKAQYVIHTGKMENVLPTLEGKFHAVLCDPPYGIAFMGKEWDTVQGPSAFQSRVKAWGEALMPLLYPGALVLMFGGTRMWHRLAAGMEDAGFEMWDTLMWLHGQGFPKAQDISKLIDKANGDERGAVIGQRQDILQKQAADLRNGHRKIKDSFDVGAPERNNGFVKISADITAAGSIQSAPWSGHKTCALKPAWEPVLCFRAPSQGKTYAELAQMFGSGALYVDGGRIVTDGGDGNGLGSLFGGLGNTFLFLHGEDRTDTMGRYPANLALDEESAELLDEQSGDKMHGDGSVTENFCETGEASWFPKRGGGAVNGMRFGDTGGASRFFYCAKSSSAERHSGIANNHPTVKPVDLCTWLATLLLPPSSVQNRRLLVPFSGSGSEMIGALGAGWDEVVGVESDAAYCDIARARIKHHNGLLSVDGTAVIQKVDDRQPELF
jgi:site-specific DNA-methyltransferase (adenine-specific)